MSQIDGNDTAEEKKNPRVYGRWREAKAHKRSVQRFIPEGDKVSRVLIHLPSFTFRRHGSWLGDSSVTMIVMSNTQCAPLLKCSATKDTSVLQCMMSDRWLKPCLEPTCMPGSPSNASSRNIKSSDKPSKRCLRKLIWKGIKKELSPIVRDLCAHMERDLIIPVSVESSASTHYEHASFTLRPAPTRLRLELPSFSGETIQWKDFWALQCCDW